MIVMKPVVEVNGSAQFGLWPVEVLPDRTLLPLHGGLTPAELGSAMLAIVSTNDNDPEEWPYPMPPRPADPLAGFLHGLLTIDSPEAYGGLRVTDTATGVVFDPACCDGVEDWRDWQRVVDGGELWYGHEPLSPHADGTGPLVRLTVNAEDPASPAIELTHAALARLLGEVEQDLSDFLALADRWAQRQLPEPFAVPVTDALARILSPGHPLG
ncbi:hypothetical protein ACIRBX_04000 [Kitasatospora sp. NPDC096147]|uniref:hypothetical protein n=1 Tax=Kitasatospora sp. NPDC096147 TaxID=3364093 RepID=UPI00381E3EBE